MVNKILLLLLLSGASFAGDKLKVVVIDTGIDYNHKDLSKRVPKEYKVAEQMDDHGHGTHIAGIINTGACDGVELIPCKYYYVGGSGYNNLSNEIECIVKATKIKANVINLSGGGEDPSGAEAVAIQAFVKQGGVFIAAAGNDGRSLDERGYYPACYEIPNLVIVGSITAEGKQVSSSNYGKKVKFEVGQSVTSTLPGNRYGKMSGTSQATANYTKKVVYGWCKTGKIRLH